MQGKTTEKKSSIIRSLYFYLASLVTLGIVVGSLIFLINIGLKTWVFTEADSVYYRLGPPSTLYIVDEVDTRTEPTFDTLVCDEECTVTASQKNDIENWTTEYTNWQEAKDNPISYIYDDLASALSFLIVALPFFIFHYRRVQKDAKKDDDEEKEKDVIRPAYFYFIALAALLMFVISTGMMINLGLKVWVFPESTDSSRFIETHSIAMKGFDETAPVQSLIDCGEKCEIDEDTIALAEQWLIDYDEWKNSDYRGYNNNQRQAAAAIPYILVGIPLFWYHWNIARSRKSVKGGSASGEKKEVTEDKKEE